MLSSGQKNKCASYSFGDFNKPFSTDRRLNLLSSLVSVGVRGLRRHRMKRQRPLCASVRLSDGSRPQSCRCRCVWCALHLSSRALRHWRTVWLRPFLDLFIWSSIFIKLWSGRQFFLGGMRADNVYKNFQQQMHFLALSSIIGHILSSVYIYVYKCYLSPQYTASLLVHSSSCSHIEKVGWIKEPKHNSDDEPRRHTHACMHADAFAERIAGQQLWG